MLHLPHIYRMRNKSAFTMIEILVVATIFSILAIGLGTAFVSGMKIWDKARNWTFDRSNFLLDLETISADLRQSVPIPAVGFEGTSDGISFSSVSGTSIMKVTYAFNAEEKILSRKEIGIKYISLPEDQQEGHYKQKQFPAWEGLSLSYLYFDSEKGVYTWADTWEKEKGIFTAVKMEVKFKGEEFVKTVFVPISIS